MYAMPRVNSDFFAPPDVDAAHDSWGANCGPSAIAAAFGLSLSAVKVAVSKRGSFPGYMGIPDIRRACNVLGRGCPRGTPSPGPIGLWSEVEGTQLAMINIDGPWREHPRRQASHRHIVAARFDTAAGWRVYDVNVNAWLGARPWIDLVMDPLAERHDPASTGLWDFRWRGTLAESA